MTIGYAAFQTNLNITAKGNVKEKSRVIQSWSSTDTTDFHSDFYKENIVNVTFLDNADVPSNATESWNVSENKTHGGVMAWVIPNNEDNTKYNLYIGAKDGVIANEDSSFLFNSFINLETISFNDNFDTSNSINMMSMFGYSSKISNLDLSSFDTSKVTKMDNMFLHCEELAYLDVSSFQTENVKSMIAMFSDLYKMTELNLCSFSTQNLTNVSNMFVRSSNLKKVYVGSGFDISNATQTTMFWSSGVSEVTTGEC